LSEPDATAWDTAPGVARLPMIYRRYNEEAVGLRLRLDAANGYPHIMDGDWEHVMSDTTTPQPSPTPPSVVTPSPVTDVRTLAIIVYGLYIAALFTGGASGLVGVVLAYVKRNDTKGTPFESHFENAIQAFWIWLIGFVVGLLTTWLFLIGFLIMLAAFAYFLYRTIKGLILAIDSKPYA